MDYQKLYNKYLDYFKTTNHRDRLIKRNSQDVRLNYESIYTETHHIIPTKMGGGDTDDNKVVLLPEEHLFIHMFRYRLYKTRVDMLAVRYAINGYNNKRSLNGVKMAISKRLLNGVAFMRQNSATFRKEHGWQTPDGLRRISEARKGTMVVVDKITREPIGCVSTSHPKVLSGEWIHHSTGYLSAYDNILEKKVRITTKEYAEGRERYKSVKVSSGSNNANHSGLSDEDIINYGVELCLMENKIVSYPRLILYAKNKYNINIPKSLSACRFEGKGRQGYYNKVYEKTALQCDSKLKKGMS